jgi:hypothetical protein
MMEPLRFTDSSGRRWLVYDFRIVDRRKRAVPMNDASAEARAFVPADREDSVLIYAFGHVSYRVTTPKVLEDQLRFAKPLDATPAERMARE